MNPSKNLVIEMTITPKAPLSISMPVARGTSENRWHNFPVMPCGQNDEGGLIETAFLPASTVRGAMRRGAAMSRIQALDGISAAQAYEMIVGQNSDSEKEQDKIDLQAIDDERNSKPIIDLFGAGLNIKSRLDFLGHFMPDNPVLPVSITSVRKDIDTTEGALEALSEDDRELSILRVDLNSRRATSEGLVEQLERKLKSRRNPLPAENVPEVEKELAEAKKLLKSVNEEMKEKLGAEAMKISTRAIFQHYALPPNIPLKGTLLVRKYRDRDMDILMDAFDALSRQPILGAHSARGGGGYIDFVSEMRMDGMLIRTVSSGGIDRPAKIVEFEQ